MKKVSIIIPVYNVEKYLKKCLDSVVKQTYKNIEIIIIDDGSNDGSSEICKKYLNDERIIYKKTINSGVSNARNLGIKISTGDYITFIDSDDWILENYIQELVIEITQQKGDIIFSNCFDVKDGKKQLNKTIEEKTSSQGIEKIFNDYFLKKRHAYSIWGKLYQKEIVKNIKFRNLKYGEDTLFLFELINKSTKQVYTTYAGYHYLVRETGAMNSLNELKKSKDNLEASKIICSKGIKEGSYKIRQKCQKKLNTDLFWNFKMLLKNDFKDQDIINTINKTKFKIKSIKAVILKIYTYNIKKVNKTIKRLLTAK